MSQKVPLWKQYQKEKKKHGKAKIRFIQSLKKCNFSFPSLCLLIFSKYTKKSKSIRKRIDRDPKLSNAICFEITTQTMEELLIGRKASMKFMTKPIYAAKADVCLIHPPGRHTCTQVADRCMIANTKRVAFSRRMYGNPLFTNLL